MIGNKSFPVRRSFNDLVDRLDCKSFMPDYQYFTFQKFLSQVSRLGKNTLISLFDVKDAYKHCRMRPDQLWQQVYRVGDSYFVDLGGTFGSRNAGDAWNRVMELIVSSMRHHGSLKELNYFVDNGENCTPPLDSNTPDWRRARDEFKFII